MTDLFGLDDAGAILSSDRRYRYYLWRTWDRRLPCAEFYMLNPSIADAASNDPTIRKCTGFAKRWGCGGIKVLNLFAYRATDPKDLSEAEDPVGPYWRVWVKKATDTRSKIHVAAWGVHRILHDSAQPRLLLSILKNKAIHPYVLGLTKHGHPRHPLYVPYTATPIPFNPLEYV